MEKHLYSFIYFLRHKDSDKIAYLCKKEGKNLEGNEKRAYFAHRKQATPFFLEWIWPSSGGFFISYYSMAQRVTFYIDGFNFYYGLRRTRKVEPWWGNYYWIDMVKFCSSFLGDDQELSKVVYFTASPLNPDKSSRQSAFLNANSLINGEKFEVVRGKYLEKQISCPNCHYSISRPEEKKTDVNISVRMIGDCVLDKTDCVVLVSADSDLVPPLEFIQQHYPEKRIKVYFPPSNYSNDLKDNLIHHSSKPVLLYKNEHRFRDAIMPDEVAIGTSRYTKPEKWHLF